ncbi:TSUP family transporter [Corynebacterium sp. 4HC-13]|uniref:TSUP family transporter n=1 Tax=Corynebacterium anserum TaxID=2684406 RepID=UPI001639F0CC|nr:TSUP family transporter [Corynebacterium anserum]MBC2681359.1 TSUP family transporter [Corynebacterium anserum]
MSPLVISVLLIGSLLAGWVDAVVGGGGLILIPLVMIMNPGFSNAQALGVNKVAAIFGTGSSAVTLSRKVPGTTSAIRYAPLALLGSAFGAAVASSVDKQIMRPVIIVLLIAVGCFVLLRPSFGKGTSGKTVTKKSTIVILCAIGAISIYDGLFGPGTGLFLIMGLTSILGKDFISSAAWAKVINVFTNLGALLTFAIQGEVLWLLGFALAVTNVVGAQIGAHMVLNRGSSFIRIVILIVVVAMAAKLSLDQLGISLT